MTLYTSLVVGMLNKKNSTSSTPFDTTTNKWALLSNGKTGPAHRSYHATAADDHHVYIFGGCGFSGRLNDLWAFDTINQKWTQFPLPGENCKGRGGPGLAVVQDKIWIIYGFAGKEVDDVHYFDLLTKEWTEIETTANR